MRVLELLKSLQKKLRFNAKFLLFLLCGGIAALANIYSRVIFNKFLSYKVSIVLAFFIGLLVAFLLFKFVVFKKKNLHNLNKEIVKFIIVNALALIQTFVVSLVFADYIFVWCNLSYHRYDIAHIIGVVTPVVTSYIFHSVFTFREN